MIELTRRQARTARSVIRRALGLSPKFGEHPMRITVDEHVGLIRSQHNGVFVEYQFSADGASESISVPTSILGDCEAARDDPVRFSRQQDDTIFVEWHDKQGPVLRTATQIENEDEFPSPPESRHELPDGFLPALADAMAVTDRKATRYSIDCVQLCGRTGRILATDSRKALVISGFEFPWDDQILLPWNGVFGLKELSRHGPVRIGRCDETLSIATGPWALHFLLETERRFPRIDDCIPKPGSEKTTLTITDADADFAITSIRNLSKSEFDNSATVVLNGTVGIRAECDGVVAIGNKPVRLAVPDSKIATACSSLNAAANGTTSSLKDAIPYSHNENARFYEELFRRLNCYLNSTSLVHFGEMSSHKPPFNRHHCCLLSRAGMMRSFCDASAPYWPGLIPACRISERSNNRAN